MSEQTAGSKARRGRPAPDQSSRARFLEAADDQFILHGYDGCTIRAIAAQAGTSLASLSRNWSSKRHLFEDVFERHFTPIHAAQNASFDALERVGNASVRDIIQAFFDSALSRSGSAGENRKSHMVYCCALTDPSEEARSITRPLVTPVRNRLIALLRQAMPELDEHSFFLAMTIVLGAYLYPQAYGERLATIMDVDLGPFDWHKASQTLAHLISAGLDRRA
jgi:AcrR family transcriptional regulator